MAASSNAAAQEPAPDVAAPREVAVVGAWRPVDAQRDAAAGPLAQSGLDLYLSAAPGAALHPGQRFDVYRRVQAPPEISLVIRVGELLIVSVQPSLAVARVVGGPDPAAQPHLKTPGVLIGDYIIEAQPKKVDQKAEPPERRPRQRRKAPPKAAEAPARPDDALPDAPDKKPDLGDKDTFEFWDQGPVEF